MDWQKAIMKEGQLYRVGGCVRDSLLGIPSHDEDFVVCGIPFWRVEEILSRFGTLKFVGKSFGVYKFRPFGCDEVDIALPRIETSTGSGHKDFDVKSDHTISIEADLQRRDFTINAIAQNVATGEYVDPTGGLKDLKDRKLQIVFASAFEDDPLRILRGCRFAARFDLTPAVSTYTLMVKNANLVSTISQERIAEEFVKLFETCDKPSIAIHWLYKSDVLKIILPELARTDGVEQNEYHTDTVYWHTLKSIDCAPKNALLRWAALLHDLGKVDTKRTDADGKVTFYNHEDVSARIARRVLTRLKYSNEFIDSCVHLVAEHMFRYESTWTDGTVRRFMNKVGVENLDNLFELRKADRGSRDKTPENWALKELKARIKSELAKETAFTMSSMAIDGNDVMSILNLQPGRSVGVVLKSCFEWVLDNPQYNNKEALGEYLKTIKF